MNMGLASRCPKGVVERSQELVFFPINALDGALGRGLTYTTEFLLLNWKYCHFLQPNFAETKITLVHIP